MSMTLSDFHALHRQKRAERPKIFELAQPDRAATADQITALENDLGIRLPPSYARFLEAYGGGEFGLAIIFSADPVGRYFLIREQRKARDLIPANCLAFSDDHSGGWYVFPVEDGMAGDAVSYWNTDGGLTRTEFSNIFEFLAQHAY